MVNPPIPNWNTNPVDYWIVRYCRGISLITAFLVGPILQTGLTRVLPFSLGVAFMTLLIGHALTRGRYFPTLALKAIFSPSDWPPQTKVSFLCYGLFVGWMALSLLWSPMPQYAARDTALLIIFLPFVHFMAIEQATNSNREFVLTVMAGLIVVSVLLMLERNGVTDNLLKLMTVSGRNSDLNRVAVLLAMLCWTPLLFAKYKPRDWMLFGVCIIVSGAAIFTSKSEAAKLSFICMLAVGALVYYIPSITRIIALAMALMMLMFPIILPKIAPPLQNETIAFLKQGHAHHRIGLWLGYKKRIDEKPIIGWGGRADRYMGHKGLVPPVDPENRYSKKNTNPHNFILEIWLNFGLIGAAIIAGLILALERLLNKLRRDQRIVGFQLLTGSFVYMCSGSSFLQGWWLATIATFVIAFIVACRQVRTIEMEIQ